MQETLQIRIPDLGDADQVEIIELLIKVGDRVAVDDPIITLESDKASMDVPAPAAGVIDSIAVAVGDTVSSGSVVASLVLAASDSTVPDTVTDRATATVTDAPIDTPKNTPRITSRAALAATDTSRAAADAGAPVVTSAAPDTAHSATPLHQTDADIVVIGSGPGGYTAAFRAADLGKRVILIERYPVLGGVCLNVGCIPSKALLHAAKVISEARDIGEHGIRFGAPQIDLDRLREWKESVVGTLTDGLGGLAKRRKVKVLTGYARFTSANTVSVVQDNISTELSFESAIIAVGSQPVELPFIPHDDPRVIDSTGALQLQEIPKRLLILGGGIIGLEMATVYHELGAKVSVVEMLDRLMPGADADIVKPLATRARRDYENIWLSTRVTAIEARSDGLDVTMQGEQAPARDVFDAVLVAVGRRPNGALIDAEKAGVDVDERGFVSVDDQQRTNVSHIYAIGDVVGQPMLAHKAVHEARVAAEVAAGEKSGFDARVIPSVAYTDPEVAWVGLTEEQANEQDVPYETGVFPWAASGRSLSLGRNEGITKLLFDPVSHRVIGAGIVGPNAGDLVGEVALAIEMGSDARDLGLTIHPHPTLSETIGFASEVFEGTITDLYIPKR